MSQSEIRKMVEQEVERRMKDNIPHNCTYCDWFRMNAVAPHNRFCKKQGMLNVENGVCQDFVLAGDWKKRRVGDITV